MKTADKNEKTGKKAAALRRQAEDQLPVNVANVSLPLSLEESQKLLHELQVHQVELEMQNEELRESRCEVESLLERYTGLYDFAPVGYLTLDRTGMICSANFTAAGLLGTERSRLLGGRFALFVVSEDRLRFSEFIAELFEQEGRGRCEVNLMLREDILLIVQIEADSFGDGRECRIAVTDITDRKRAEQQLHVAHEELERRVAERTAELAGTVESLRIEITEREKAERALKDEVCERLKVVEALREKERQLMQHNRLAAMGEMINNIAHQWRQPLNTLGLIIQQMALFYGSPQFTGEFVVEKTDKAMTLIQHMSKTIDDFRDFFSADKELKTFDVKQVVEHALALFEHGLREQGVSVRLQADGAVMASGYRNEYAQVLVNILANARTELVERAVENALITIHVFTEGTLAVVTITDNDGGIDEKIIDKLFDPYFTTKGPGKGTGIGLFMSKTIIETNMAGRLTVRNTGSGAEFRIEVNNAEM